MIVFYLPDASSGNMRVNTATSAEAADDCPKRTVKKKSSVQKNSLFLHCRPEKVDAEDDGAP
jgi:hypothetical protein